MVHNEFKKTLYTAVINIILPRALRNAEHGEYIPPVAQRDRVHEWYFVITTVSVLEQYAPRRTILLLYCFYTTRHLETFSEQSFPVVPIQKLKINRTSKRANEKR